MSVTAKMEGIGANVQRLSYEHLLKQEPKLVEKIRQLLTDGCTARMVGFRCEIWNYSEYVSYQAEQAAQYILDTQCAYCSGSGEKVVYYPATDKGTSFQPATKFTYVCRACHGSGERPKGSVAL